MNHMGINILLSALTPAMPSPSLLLKTDLIGNAAFSFASSLVFMLFPEHVSKFLGLEAAPWVRIIGAGLFFFALDLLHQATRKRLATWRALYACAGDFMWVVASLVGCIGFRDAFTSHGLIAIGIVAAVVALFGILQVFGILQAHRSSDGHHFRHCVVVGVDCSADAIWSVVAQLGEISRYMPELRRSFIRDGLPVGEGVVRECEDTSGRQWAEKCTVYDPVDHGFEVTFLANEPGFPYPAYEMRGGWQVIRLAASNPRCVCGGKSLPNPAGWQVCCCQCSAFRWIAAFQSSLSAWQPQREVKP